MFNIWIVKVLIAVVVTVVYGVWFGYTIGKLDKENVHNYSRYCWRCDCETHTELCAHCGAGSERQK